MGGEASRKEKRRGGMILTEADRFLSHKRGTSVGVKNFKKAVRGGGKLYKLEKNTGGRNQAMV